MTARLIKNLVILFGLIFLSICMFIYLPMTDNQILVLAFMLFWLTLISLTINSTKRVKTFAISFFLHLIYSIFLLYGLNYKSQFGGGLVWWFYLLLTLGGHILLNVTLISIKFFKKVNKDVKT